MLAMLGDTPEAISEVNADISLRRRGQVAVKGTGLVRGERLALDATAMSGQVERRGTLPTRMPFKMTLKGERIDVGFDGRLSIAPNDLGLSGAAEVGIPSVRQVARWLGAYWPSGPGLRDVTIKGQLNQTRTGVAFDNATVRMDGNEGTGVIALQFGHARPLVSGTLAYKAIGTKPYLSATDGVPPEPFSWASIAAGALTVPLGKHLDADLRISTEKVTLGSVELGQTAATVALKDGRLLADIANLKFDKGEGGGQITADFNGYLPKVTVRGKLERVDLGMLSASVAGVSVLQGQANVVADLAGSGATLHDVVRGMAGKLAVTLVEGGRLGIDLKGLAATAQRGQRADGWSAVRGTTAIEQMDLKLVLRDGTVLTELAELRTSDGRWSASGLVGLTSDRIDLRVSQGGAWGAIGTAARPGPAAKAARGIVDVSGALAQPSIIPISEIERRQNR